MRPGTKRTLQLVATLPLLLPTAASAQPPSGGVMFDFTNTIWDIGSINECESLSQLGYTIDICIDIVMLPDGKGKYSGSGLLDFQGDIDGALTGPASGKAKSKESSASAKIDAQTQGQLDILGYMFPSQVDFKCSGPIDGTGFLESNCKLKVKLQGAGSASVKTFLDTQLMGGPWSITFDFVPIDEKKFQGSAIDSFGFEYEVSGSYDANTATSKVDAKGLKGDKTSPDPSKGAKVQLKDMTDTFLADSKTKVAGASASEVVQGTPIP